MARRQQTSNKTKATKAANKSLVRRHSKRLQKQQRDLPALLQDLSCVTRDQASGEEDTPSVLTKSGSDISLQDASSKVSISLGISVGIAIPVTYCNGLLVCLAS